MTYQNMNGTDAGYPQEVNTFRRGRVQTETMHRYHSGDALCFVFGPLRQTPPL